MKKLFLIALGVAGSFLAQAQRIDRQVIASSGGIGASSGVQVSFTIGETAIQYLSASGVSLSQGFQQSENHFTGIRNINRIDAQVSIYPNPFIQYIEVKSDIKLNKPNFSMTDVTGRNVQISSEEIENGKHWRVQISNVDAGYYWLTVAAEDYVQTIPLSHITP